MFAQSLQTPIMQLILQQYLEDTNNKSNLAVLKYCSSLLVLTGTLVLRKTVYYLSTVLKYCTRLYSYGLLWNHSREPKK